MVFHKPVDSNKVIKEIIKVESALNKLTNHSRDRTGVMYLKKSIDRKTQLRNLAPRDLVRLQRSLIEEVQIIKELNQNRRKSA